MASNQEAEERLKVALADRYAIEREIGAGGMATVYLATEDPQAWGYSHAGAALWLGRPEEAIEALDRVSRSHPIWSNPNVWGRLAWANNLLGRYEQALTASKEGLSRGPGDLFTLFGQAQALIGLDRPGEITPTLDAMEGSEPYGNSSPGVFLRGVAAELAYHGFGDQAREVARRAIEWYQADNPDGYVASRARALIQCDSLSGALALLEPLVEGGSTDVTLQGVYGLALAHSGDQPSAEAQIEWLKEADERYIRGEHTYWQSAILAALERRDEAVRARERAYEEGWFLFWPEGVDPTFAPLWGFEPYEDLITPKG